MAQKRDSGNTQSNGNNNNIEDIDSTKALHIDVPSVPLSPPSDNPNNQTTPMLIHLMQKHQKKNRTSITPMETPTEQLESYPDTPEHVRGSKKGKHITFSVDTVINNTSTAVSPKRESTKSTVTSPTDDSSSIQPEPNSLMNHMSLHTIRSSQSDYDVNLRRKSDKLRQEVIHEETPEINDAESGFEMQSDNEEPMIIDNQEQQQEQEQDADQAPTMQIPMAVGMELSPAWETDNEEEPIPDLFDAVEKQTLTPKDMDIDKMIHPQLISQHSAPMRKSLAEKTFELKSKTSSGSGSGSGSGSTSSSNPRQITVLLNKPDDGSIFRRPGSKKKIGRPRVGSAPKRQSTIYSRNQIKPIEPPRRPSRSKSRNSRSILSSETKREKSGDSSKTKKSHVHFDANTKHPDNKKSATKPGLSRHSSARDMPHVDHLDISAQKRRSFHVSSATQPQITFKTPISAKNIGDKLSTKNNPNLKVKNLGFVQVTNALTGKKETLFLRKKKKRNNTKPRRRKVIKMHSQQILDSAKKQDDNKSNKEEFFSEEELAAAQKRFPDYYKRVSKHRNYASEHVTQSPRNTKTLQTNISKDTAKDIDQSQTPVPVKREYTNVATSSNTNANNKKTDQDTNKNKTGYSNMTVPKHQVFSSSPTDTAYSITNSKQIGNINNVVLPSPIENRQNPYQVLKTDSNFSTPSTNPKARPTFSGAPPMKDFKLNTNAELINTVNAISFAMTPTTEEEEMKSFKPMRAKPGTKKLNVQITEDNGNNVHNLSPTTTTDHDHGHGHDRNGGGSTNASSHIMLVDLKSESDALSLGEHMYNNYQYDVEMSMISNDSKKSNSKYRQWHKRVASKLSDIFAIDGRFDDGIYIDELEYDYYAMDSNKGGYQNDAQ